MVRKSLLFCLFFSVIYGQKRSQVGQRVQEHQQPHPHSHQHSYPPMETQVIEYEVPCPPPQPYPEQQPYTEYVEQKMEKPAPANGQQAVYYTPIDSYPQNKYAQYENKYENKYAQYKKYYNQQFAKKAEPVYAPSDYQQYQTVYESYPQQQQQQAPAPVASAPVCAEEPNQPQQPNKKSPSIQIFLV